MAQPSASCFADQRTHASPTTFPRTFSALLGEKKPTIAPTIALTKASGRILSSPKSDRARTIAKISTMIPSMPPPRKPATAPSARVVRETESFMEWPDRPAQISPLVQPLKESFIVQFLHEAHINEIFRPGGFDLGIFLGQVVEASLVAGNRRVGFFRDDFQGDLLVGFVQRLAVGGLEVFA